MYQLNRRQEPNTQGYEVAYRTCGTAYQVLFKVHKKRGPKSPDSVRSEGVLQTEFGAVSTVNTSNARTNEGDFAVCAEVIGQGNAKTCLT